MEPLYYIASKDYNGDIIVKMVNVTREERKVTLRLDNLVAKKRTVCAMEGYSPVKDVPEEG